MKHHPISRRTFCVRAAQASFGITLAGLHALPYGAATHDVTIDLTRSENAVLKNIGGAMYVEIPSTGERIIVVRNSETQVSAFSSVCTHLDCRVELPKDGAALCPCHGSRFSDTGAVLAGPAKTDLKPWYATLDGSSIHIDKEPPSAVRPNTPSEKAALSLNVTIHQTKERITVRWRRGVNALPATVSLFDLKGQRTSHIVWNNTGSVSLSTRTLNSGRYILKVYVNGNTAVTRPIQL